MKRALMTTMVGLAPAMAAAADLPARTAPPAPPPTFLQVERWSGFYAGVGGGWAFGGSRSRISYAAARPDEPGFTSDRVFLGPGYFNALAEFVSLTDPCPTCMAIPPNGYLANPNLAWPTSLGRRSDGALATLTAGYNWQRGSFVVGVEADVSLLRDRGRAAWSGFGARAFAVDPPAEEPDPPNPPTEPLIINGIGNYNKYTERGYDCEPTFPPPPKNRWSCTAPPTTLAPTNGTLQTTDTLVLGDYTLEARMSVRARTTWLSTARLRAGFTTGPLFFYATGGLAFGGAQLSVAAEAVETLTVRVTEANGMSPPAPAPAQTPQLPPVMAPAVATSTQTTVTTWNASRDRTEVGFALGAGAEWALNDAWSLKGEYVYYNLGSRSLRATGRSVTTGTGIVGELVESSTPITLRHKFDGHIVRVGLNYRFGGSAGSATAGR